jgi:ATP-binding cassette subfamily C protein
LTIEVDKLRRWEGSQLEKRRDLDDSLLNRAYQRIAEIFNPDAAPEAMTAPPGAGLFAVCRLVGRKLDIDFQNPGGQKQYQSKGDMDQALRDIAQSSRVRMRYVALRGHWWNKDLGPLVAFVGEERKPVALLPESPHQYMLIDPEGGERKAVDAAVAEGLYPFAVFFYRSLPQRIQSGRELVKFGFKGCRTDFNIILTMVLVAGLLGLVTPLGTEVVFSDVIPKANMNYLWQIFMILLACYLASGALNLVRDFAVLRIAGKMESSLEAAVWDRLLNLAPPFFKKYASGDLALRAMGINTIRQMASNVVVSNTLGGLASSLNLLVMFYYSWRLSLLGIGLAVIAVSITVITTRAQLAHQRVVFDIQGKISALVIQMVNGINKLRSAGAENRAFSVWARKFSDQKKETLKAGKISNILQAINAGLPILSTAAIFTWLAFYDESDIEMSEFLAFNTAFGAFLSSCLMMSTSLIAMLNAVPVYERLRPIIEAEPETDPQKGKPGELSGRVAMHKLSFRYQSDGPLILQGIDLIMQPGEFVALVGPSGSGKSTMLRLLLGFEAPEEGSIFYDQYDLASVDCHEIRRQIGVVLQSAQLMTGTIFSNIAGSANVSQEQAWEAARLAGFEQDIKAMPMGLETMVSEGGSTLSGGQRQRLLIARALIKRPRILYFDEATSALDNQTQSVVARSLEQLKATRLVIAHRLSTVINADRIVVLKDGRIVEQGPYDQLIKAGGEFERLARRQLA